MNSLHYIGFDVHKKAISFCVKTAAGEIVEEGSVLAQREVLRQWASSRPQPWRGAMEATLFSAWIYDTLKPYGEQLEMAHPAKMKAISAGKKKSDTIDARTIADLVRCNLLPACYVAPPRIRELRRLLRYRSLVVSEAVRMKNKMSGLLMETGALYVKEKLHRKKYFASLLEELEEVPESVIDLLRLSRGALEMFETTQKRLVRELLADPELTERVERLMTIPAVGEITALTWALEVGDPQRFPSCSDAMSYCGLTAALKSSAGKQQRGPISKQRNRWLQTTLIEAAKLAPRWNPQLAALHARELERGHRNRATLAVARKLVAYLLAVDKSGQAFQVRVPLEEPTQKAAGEGKTLNSAAIVRPFLANMGTGQRSLDSRCSLPSVSRPAGKP
jgi:transposase